MKGKSVYLFPVDLDGAQSVTVDVYAVLKAFEVTCPARQHAIKKLLCSGIRGKGDAKQDLQESMDAIQRGIQMLPLVSEPFDITPAADEPEQEIDPHA